MGSLTDILDPLDLSGRGKARDQAEADERQFAREDAAKREKDRDKQEARLSAEKAAQRAAARKSEGAAAARATRQGVAKQVTRVGLTTRTDDAVTNGVSIK